MNEPYKLTVKKLVETLLNNLEPSAEVQIVSEFADELGKGGRDLMVFDAGYRDDKFIIRVVDWL